MREDTETRRHGENYIHILLRTRGRITIPISIRRKLGIKKGTHIHFEVDENARRIILTPITREYVHRVRGMFKGSGAFEVLMEEKRREKDSEETKLKMFYRE